MSVIAHDKHFSPDEPFKFKKLEQEVQLLPGDELRVDCTYDTTHAHGKVMIGGNSLESEMCIAFIEYYGEKPDEDAVAAVDVDVLDLDQRVIGPSVGVDHDLALHALALTHQSGGHRPADGTQR